MSTAIVTYLPTDFIDLRDHHEALDQLKELNRGSGFSITIQRTKTDQTALKQTRKVFLRCGRSRPYTPRTQGLRKSTTRSTECPWRASLTRQEPGWRVDVTAAEHNHELDYVTPPPPEPKKVQKPKAFQAIETQPAQLEQQQQQQQHHQHQHQQHAHEAQQAHQTQQQQHSHHPAHHQTSHHQAHHQPHRHQIGYQPYPLPTDSQSHAQKKASGRPRKNATPVGTGADGSNTNSYSNNANSNNNNNNNNQSGPSRANGRALVPVNAQYNTLNAPQPYTGYAPAQASVHGGYYQGDGAPARTASGNPEAPNFEQTYPFPPYPPPPNQNAIQLPPQLPPQTLPPQAPPQPTPQATPAPAPAQTQAPAPSSRGASAARNQTAASTTGGRYNYHRPPPTVQRVKISPEHRSVFTSKNPFSIRPPAFVTYHDDFEQLLGQNPQLNIAYEDRVPFAHNVGVYLPDKDFVLVASNQFVPDGKYEKTVTVSKLARAEDGSWRRDNIPTLAVMAAGGTNYQGGIMLCTQGDYRDPGGLIFMEPDKPFRTRPVLNHFNGRRFNSLENLALHSDGSIWFTDPIYGYEQGTRPKPELPNAVYRFDPKDGGVRVVADGFGRPNGICFSPDEKVVFITDTDQIHGDGSVDKTRAATIYASDILVDRSTVWLVNRRVFAAPDFGAPCGIECDTAGNLYAGCGDGVNVWNPRGMLLGKILIPDGVASFCFGRPGELFLLNDKKFWLLKLAKRVRGAVLDRAGLQVDAADGDDGVQEANTYGGGSRQGGGNGREGGGGGGGGTREGESDEDSLFGS